MFLRCPSTYSSVFIVREYVQGLKNADELLDMISSAVEDQGSKLMKGEMLYPEVYPCSLHYLQIQIEAYACLPSITPYRR